MKTWIAIGLLSFLLLALLTACTQTTAVDSHDTNHDEGETASTAETTEGEWAFQTDAAPAETEPPEIDNRLDTFEENVITVNNSDYAISAELTAAVMETMARYRFDTSFYVIDLETRMSIGYNGDQKYSTASTVKAGYALYCFKEIAAGNASYDDRIVYREKHYVSGSGSTKNSVYGTVFTVKALLYRMLYNSDNIAYYMLLDYFGVEGYNSMAEALGIEHRISESDKWGDYSPHELGLIWKEIYDYRDETDEGRKLWEYLTSNLYNEIQEELSEYEVIAHKSGWDGQGYHDSGVVYGYRPYIMVVMTGTGYKNACLYEVIRCLDDIMKEYESWMVK